MGTKNSKTSKETVQIIRANSRRNHRFIEKQSELYPSKCFVEQKGIDIVYRFTAFETTSENYMRLSPIHFFNIFDYRPLGVIAMPRVTLKNHIRQVNKLQPWTWETEMM